MMLSGSGRLACGYAMYNRREYVGMTCHDSTACDAYNNLRLAQSSRPFQAIDTSMLQWDAKVWSNHKPSYTTVVCLALV